MHNRTDHPSVQQQAIKEPLNLFTRRESQPVRFDYLHEQTWEEVRTSDHRDQTKVWQVWPTYSWKGNNGKMGPRGEGRWVRKGQRSAADVFRRFPLKKLGGPLYVEFWLEHPLTNFDKSWTTSLTNDDRMTTSERGGILPDPVVIEERGVELNW